MDKDFFINTKDYSNLLKKININMLKYFVVLSEVKDFNLASERLNITTQALSKAILNMENEIGTLLIERNKIPNELTNSGLFILNKANIILENLADLKLIYKKQSFESFKIGFGCNHKSFLPVIELFYKKYPNVILEVYYMFGKSLEHYINYHQIDVGFTIHDFKETNMELVKCCENDFVIVSNTNEINKKWSDLKYIKNMSLTKYGYQDWNDNIYPREIIARTNSLECAIQLCKSGLGSYYIQEIDVRYQIENKELFIISKPPFEKSNKVFMSWNKKNTKSELLNDFLDMAKKYFNLSI